jgi:hypothetical protein
MNIEVTAKWPLDQRFLVVLQGCSTTIPVLAPPAVIVKDLWGHTTVVANNKSKGRHVPGGGRGIHHRPENVQQFPPYCHNKKASFHSISTTHNVCWQRGERHPAFKHLKMSQ